jgi:shikimate dehydrogenase
VPDGGRFIVGLIGSSVGTSLSPPLHENEADQLGLRYLYQLIDLDSLGLSAEDVGDLLVQANRMGFAGLNITHPCKQTVLEHLDELSLEAQVLGAVNTVLFQGGRSIGHNTDWSGFAAGFTRGLPNAPMGKVLVLGAGGAGAAVSYALLGLGARQVTVMDVAAERAEQLADRLRGQAPNGRAGTIAAAPWDALEQTVREVDGVVNASNVGMTPRLGMPIPASYLRKDMWVADVVYRPLETELLAHARQLGCRTLGGGGMVVFQAAESFHLFTGRTPNPERMYRHFEALTAEAVAA